MLCELSFIWDNAMWNGVLRVVHFKINFLLRFWSDYYEISMASANIDALYVGSLKIKIYISFPRNFTFYKWCVTKVAHCMQQFQLKKRKDRHETSWWKAEVYSFYLVSLSFNTEIELLMKKGNQSNTTVCILIMQLRFKKKHLPLHYLPPPPGCCVV